MAWLMLLTPVVLADTGTECDAPSDRQLLDDGTCYAASLDSCCPEGGCSPFEGAVRDLEALRECSPGSEAGYYYYSSEWEQSIKYWYGPSRELLSVKRFSGEYCCEGALVEVLQCASTPMCLLPVSAETGAEPAAAEMPDCSAGGSCSALRVRTGEFGAVMVLLVALWGRREE